MSGMATRLEFRCTEDFYSSMESAAGRLGLSLSAWVRMSLAQAVNSTGAPAPSPTGAALQPATPTAKPQAKTRKPKPASKPEPRTPSVEPSEADTSFPKPLPGEFWQDYNNRIDRVVASSPSMFELGQRLKAEYKANPRAKTGA